MFRYEPGSPHPISLSWGGLLMRRWLTMCMYYAGPKTVFFWGPAMKWCLVAAGLKDLARPAGKLSVSQNIGAYYLCARYVL